MERLGIPQPPGAAVTAFVTVMASPLEAVNGPLTLLTKRSGPVIVITLPATALFVSSRSVMDCP